MKSLADLTVKIFADGADKAGIQALYNNPLIQGLTTNPTLMRKAGISDFEAFTRDILQIVKTKPISFEVFADDFPEMKRQALKVGRWQDNVFVKIPITNTRRESSLELIRELGREGVKLNITAILTLDQVRGVADTGFDPVPLMRESKQLLTAQPKAELLWASVREVLNIQQANDCGSDIVSVPHDILNKAIKMWGMDLADLSLDTVKMFANDASAAGYKL